MCACGPCACLVFYSLRAHTNASARASVATVSAAAAALTNSSARASTSTAPAAPHRPLKPPATPAATGLATNGAVAAALAAELARIGVRLQPPQQLPGRGRHSSNPPAAAPRAADGDAADR